MFIVLACVLYYKCQTVTTMFTVTELIIFCGQGHYAINLYRLPFLYFPENKIACFFPFFSELFLF